MKGWRRMSKSNPIGHTNCHICGFEEAEVKTDKNGKTYIYCPDCNIQSFTRTEYQSTKLFLKMRPVTVTEAQAPKIEPITAILPVQPVQKPAAPSGFNMDL